MVNEYIGLITHLIAFKRKHPEYAEKIYKVLKVMEVDKILINAIEEDLSTGDEQYGQQQPNRLFSPQSMRYLRTCIKRPHSLHRQVN